MYSAKKNVLQTVALLKAHGIFQMVLSPGSRNAPLIQSFTCDPFFSCWSVVDERSAGYFAIGLIYKTKCPVVVCCTSGSALLNYAPAVAEAFYQKLPLIVISADRSPAWIGQMDGQTIPQPGVFGPLVKHSVQLPEIHSEEDLWHCNRLINEALIACSNNDQGPVHINVPISEPLFDFSVEKLPDTRCMTSVSSDKPVDLTPFLDEWHASGKRMIVVGQQFRNRPLEAILESLTAKSDAIVLCEHLSNMTSPRFIGNFDALTGSLEAAETNSFAPDLLITLGGHLVSKQLKQFLRNNKPTVHWHISGSLNVVDTYQSLTRLVEANPVSFMKGLSTEITPQKESHFAETWRKASASIRQPDDHLPFSDMTAAGTFLKYLPSNSALIVGNSSSVRNIQLYPLNQEVEIFCNRGTNGIEGSISTAAGYSSQQAELTFLMIGDLSFFYDLSGLWNNYPTERLRILLINNGGGGIFHLLPGLHQSARLEQFVAARHDQSAEAWVKAAGLTYLKANDRQSLETALSEFIDKEAGKGMVLEVFTTVEENRAASLTYYSTLKQR